MQSFTNLSETLQRAFRNRVSPSNSNPTTASSKPLGRKGLRPSDRRYAQVVHSSTPATSPVTSPSASFVEQDPESPTLEVEEIGDHTASKTRPPSQDSIDDGRPIFDRLQEIRSLISSLKGMQHQENYLQEAPPPCTKT